MSGKQHAPSALPPGNNPVLPVLFVPGGPRSGLDVCAGEKISYHDLCCRLVCFLEIAGGVRLTLRFGHYFVAGHFTAVHSASAVSTAQVIYFVLSRDHRLLLVKDGVLLNPPAGEEATISCNGLFIVYSEDRARYIFVFNSLQELGLSRRRLAQSFSTSVRPRPGKIFFIRRGPGPNRLTRQYLSNFFKFIH